jgi:putative flippase GtrA
MATTRWAPEHRLLATDPERHHELGTHAAWYAVAGVVTTGVQAILFLLLRDELGAQVANLVAIAVTTVGNTEFHRRVTFAGRNSNAGKRHLQDFLTFAFYAGYGSAVLAILDAVVERPTSWEETGTLLMASLVGGVARFAVLRWWVFAHRTGPAVAAHTG